MDLLNSPEAQAFLLAELHVLDAKRLIANAPATVSRDKLRQRHRHLKGDRDRARMAFLDLHRVGPNKAIQPKPVTAEAAVPVEPETVAAKPRRRAAKLAAAERGLDAGDGR